MEDGGMGFLIRGRMGEGVSKSEEGWGKGCLIKDWKREAVFMQYDGRGKCRNVSELKFSLSLLK